MRARSRVREVESTVDPSGMGGAFHVLEWLVQPDFADQFGVNVELALTASNQRYNFSVATIQIKQVPPDIHRRFRNRAAAAGQSLQQYMLDSVDVLC